MTFAQIPAGAEVFLDANTLVYHFTGHLTFGPACTQLLTRIERQELAGFVSTHILIEVSHRLMILEAIQRLGWPPAGIAARLRKHHGEIARLAEHVQAIARVPVMGIQIIATTYPLVETATLVSRQFELLTGDALLVAVMQAHGLTHLASNDADFNRVPGLIRYAPLDRSSARSVGCVQTTHPTGSSPESVEEAGQPHRAREPAGGPGSCPLPL